MSNLKARFDEAAVEARRAYINNTSEVRAQIPGLWSDDFRRLLTGISELLEKVDRGSVQHPEYLAHTNGHIGEYAISLVAGVPSALEAGATTFTQTILPGLLLCEERLSKAVGKHHHKVREVKDQYVRELQKLAEEAREFRVLADDASVETIGFREQAEEASKAAAECQAHAANVQAEIDKTRQLVEKLASGDGRGKSLEALKRLAEKKVEAIDDVLVKSLTAKANAEKANVALSDAQKSISGLMERLKAIETQAQEVLALSSQAGLATSYINESKNLRTRSYIFTGILYATTVATVLIAAFYVLPSLERNAQNGGVLIDSTAVYLTLLRATVLAPLVFVLYFTTRQISSLETLRMDYAEKAAASLAYSGYKDEMSVDGNLLDQLRGSLLLRFAEHPERLLRKIPAKESLNIRFPGFSASSQSDSGPSQAGVARPSSTTDPE